MRVLKKFVKKYVRLKKVLIFFRRVIFPIINIIGWRKYVEYLKDFYRYKSASLKSGGIVPLLDLYPCLEDKTSTTSIDVHYFYMNIWAAKKIYTSGAKEHIDIGSQAIYVGMLSIFTEVTFVDIRPLVIDIEHYHGKNGSILNLPYRNNSVASLSCLHVAEHIGLGRYGDRIDPEGTRKACAELVRVLAPGGNLFFAVPIGRSRVCFNAHRVHTSSQISEYFGGLTLIEFSGVNDAGEFGQAITPFSLDQEEYGCGLFWFTKP